MTSTKTTVERMFEAARGKNGKKLSTLVLKFEQEAALGSPAMMFWRLRQENARYRRWLMRWWNRLRGKTMGRKNAEVTLTELVAALRGDEAPRPIRTKKH